MPGTVAARAAGGPVDLEVFVPDGVVTQLIELLGGGLKLSLLQTALSPATAMSTWLTEKEAPAGFSIDRECELKQPDSEKASVRYTRHTLDIDEVAEHIRQGKLPTQLALTWGGRVSFVLTEALTLKKIELLDVVLEGAGGDAGKAGQERRRVVYIHIHQLGRAGLSRQHRRQLLRFRLCRARLYSFRVAPEAQE